MDYVHQTVDSDKLLNIFDLPHNKITVNCYLLTNKKIERNKRSRDTLLLRGKSEHRRAGRRLMTGGGDSKESATERYRLNRS